MPTPFYGMKTLSNLTWAVGILMLPLTPPSAAQNGTAARNPAPLTSAWSPPRTPYGDPDLQGIQEQCIHHSIGTAE